MALYCMNASYVQYSEISFLLLQIQLFVIHSRYCYVIGSSHGCFLYTFVFSTMTLNNYLLTAFIISL